MLVSELPLALRFDNTSRELSDLATVTRSLLGGQRPFAKLLYNMRINQPRDTFDIILVKYFCDRSNQSDIEKFGREVVLYWGKVVESLEKLLISEKSFFSAITSPSFEPENKAQFFIETRKKHSWCDQDVDNLVKTCRENLQKFFESIQVVQGNLNSLPALHNLSQKLEGEVVRLYREITSLRERQVGDVVRQETAVNSTTLYLLMKQEEEILYSIQGKTYCSVECKHQEERKLELKLQEIQVKISAEKQKMIEAVKRMADREWEKMMNCSELTQAKKRLKETKRLLNDCYTKIWNMQASCWGLNQATIQEFMEFVVPLQDCLFKATAVIQKVSTTYYSCNLTLESKTQCSETMFLSLSGLFSNYAALQLSMGDFGLWTTTKLNEWYLFSIVTPSNNNTAMEMSTTRVEGEIDLKALEDSMSLWT